MTTPQERLASGHYNSGAKSDTNPGGMAKGGHRDNFPLALTDVADVAKQVGDNAAIAAAAASQGDAWLYEGVPGNVQRISDTQIAIKAVNRTSLYLAKPNPRALRLVQSKPYSRLLSNNQLLNATPFTLTGTTANDLSMANPFGVSNKASQLNEVNGGTAHVAEISYPGYAANEYVVFSAALKSNARYRGRIGLQSSGWANSISMTFDLNAGTAAAAAAAGTAANIAGGIFPLGNSWHRVWIAGKLATSAGAAVAQLAIADNSGALSYSGVAGNGIQVYDVSFQKLSASPAGDNDFMFVSASEWDAAANATIVTILNGFVSANFGAYKDADTDGLYYGQDPNNAPRAGGSAGKIYMAQNCNAVGMNW